MTTTNQPGTDDAAYRHGAAVVGPETEMQERLERAKRGLAPIVEDEDLGPTSYDPSIDKEKPRPNFERTTYRPKPCSFNQILELWAAHEGGTLTRIGNNDPGRNSDGYGEDEALGAWNWVSETEGWGPVVHEVMRHLVFRNRTWAEWPIAAPVLAYRFECGHMVTVPDGKKTKQVFVADPPEYRSYCEWPFITKERAGAAWIPFYRALRKKYRLTPFCKNEQTVEMAGLGKR